MLAVRACFSPRACVRMCEMRALSKQTLYAHVCVLTAHVRARQCSFIVFSYIYLCVFFYFVASVCVLAVRACFSPRACVRCVCVLPKLFMPACLLNTLARVGQYCFIIFISFVLIAVFLFYFVVSASVLPVCRCFPSACVCTCVCVCACCLYSVCPRACGLSVCLFFFCFYFIFVLFCCECLCARCACVLSVRVHLAHVVFVRACCLHSKLVCTRAC